MCQACGFLSDEIKCLALFLRQYLFADDSILGKYPSGEHQDARKVEGHASGRATVLVGSCLAVRPLRHQHGMKDLLGNILDSDG